jgi:hypothetical protein
MLMFVVVNGTTWNVSHYHLINFQVFANKNHLRRLKFIAGLYFERNCVYWTNICFLLPVDGASDMWSIYRQ